MGADFKEQRKAVKEIRGLDTETRGWLGHHIRNSLMSLSLHIELGDAEKAKEVIDHMTLDLEMFGI